MNSAPWRLALASGAFAGCASAAAVGGSMAALVLVTAGVVAILIADRRLLTVCLVVAAGSAGWWRGTTFGTAGAGPTGIAAHLGSGDVVLRGTVGDAGVPGRDDTIVVNVVAIATPGGTWSIDHGAVVAEPRIAVDVLPGDTVDVETTSLRAPPQRPGALSAVALERVGATAIAAAARVSVIAHGTLSIPRAAVLLRRALAADVARTLPEPQATLVLGIAFGIHATLAGSVRTPLQDAGLIHVVAVSGLMTYYYVYGNERRHLRPDLARR